MGAPGEQRALRALLDDALTELALQPPADVGDRLVRAALLLERWAARINLTGHRDARAILLRLVVDAAALSTKLPELASLVDLGAGAGFPGIPLAILRPRCQVTLVDSRLRRFHFQRALVRELDLTNVEPRLGRAEQLDPRPAAAAIAQAVTSPVRAVRWLLPWVETGGLVLIPGTDRSPRIPEMEGIETGRWVEYRVPLGGPERRLWIGRRS